MKDLKIALEGWFALELYDHCQKGLAVFAIIWNGNLSAARQSLFQMRLVSFA